MKFVANQFDTSLTECATAEQPRTPIAEIHLCFANDVSNAVGLPFVPRPVGIDQAASQHHVATAFPMNRGPPLGMPFNPSLNRRAAASARRHEVRDSRRVARRHRRLQAAIHL